MYIVRVVFKEEIPELILKDVKNVFLKDDFLYLIADDGSQTIISKSNIIYHQVIAQPEPLNVEAAKDIEPKKKVSKNA